MRKQLELLSKLHFQLEFFLLFLAIIGINCLYLKSCFGVNWNQSSCHQTQNGVNMLMKSVVSY